MYPITFIRKKLFFAYKYDQRKYITIRLILLNFYKTKHSKQPKSPNKATPKGSYFKRLKVLIKRCVFIFPNLSFLFNVFCWFLQSFQKDPSGATICVASLKEWFFRWVTFFPCYNFIRFWGKHLKYILF